MSNENVPEWIDAESKRVESERQKYQEEHGQLSFWKPSEGVQQIEVLVDKKPEQSKYENKVELHILVNGNEHIWTVNTRSPLYRELLQQLKTGARKFNLIRMGTSAEDTRYKLSLPAG